MSRRLKPTVIHAKEIRLSPVPAGMRAHGQPEIAGLPEGCGRKQRKNRGSNDSYFCLAAITHVDTSKQDGLNNGSRPEANAFRQGVQEITAKGKFLKEPDQQKDEPPNDAPAKNLAVDWAEPAEIENIQDMQNKQQQRQRHKSPEQIPFAEAAKKRLAQRQTVNAHFLFFNFAHDPGKQQDHQKQK